MVNQPKTAMLLAAGLGTRMRPLSLKVPKPLVRIAGISMLNRALAALQNAGVETVIINVHHLANQVEDQLKKTKTSLKIVVSDERDRLLESGGGVIKALPELGREPFFIVNCDSFWIDAAEPNLKLLAKKFSPATMDMLLLTINPQFAYGSKNIDFKLAKDGSLQRFVPPANNIQHHNDEGLSDVIYCGTMIAAPNIFEGGPKRKHSLNLYFDRAIKARRLYGVMLQGWWYHVGTVAAIAETEALLHQRKHDGEKGTLYKQCRRN